MINKEASKQFQQAATICLQLNEKQLESLFLILQQGFFVNACVGCSIKDFFLKQLGLRPDYIEQRIQGIFLDSKPADDIDSAILRDGSRLTLSGTMPGLVGISLRRGPFAVFRHTITYRETGNYDYSGDGCVKIKLLNLLMKEMGPRFLRQGIYMDPEVLAEYLTGLPPGFWQDCKKITLNGEQVTPEVIQMGQWVPENRVVKFTVEPL